MCFHSACISSLSHDGVSHTCNGLHQTSSAHYNRVAFVRLSYLLAILVHYIHEDQLDVHSRPVDTRRSDNTVLAAECKTLQLNCKCCCL